MCTCATMPAGLRRGADGAHRPAYPEIAARRYVAADGSFAPLASPASSLHAAASHRRYLGDPELTARRYRANSILRWARRAGI